MKALNEEQIKLVKIFRDSPELLEVFKLAINNPIMLELFKNDPSVKKLAEEQPIFKDILDNPELFIQLITPELFDTFLGMNRVKMDENNKIKIIKIKIILIMKKKK